MNCKLLASILKEGRKPLSQEDAAEAANVTKDEWANLENRRRGVTLPRDRDMLDRVARVVGLSGAAELIKEAGLL